jgi:hypothetical protein
VRLSRINELLAGDISPGELRLNAEPEFIQYTKLATKKGASMPVSVQEDAELLVSINEVRRLCQLFLEDQLAPTELAYIADILQLSEKVRFVGENIADLVAELTDPEVNGPFTKARAEEIVNDQ